MQIIDNALPPAIFLKLKRTVEDPSFAWYYGRRVNSRTETRDNLFLYGWHHFIGRVHEGKWEIENQELWTSIETGLAFAVQRIGQELNEIWRMRLILNTVADQQYLLGAHVDYERPHQTALLYLDDSDGDTVIYKERYNPMFKIHSDDHWEHIEANATEAMRVSPKANRMLFFNGLHYHAGHMPIASARRIAVNINYTIK
jgi:hypothetical protein